MQEAGEWVPRSFVGLDPLWVSTGILIVTYAAIMTERVNRAIIAGVGACLMIVVGVLNQDSAIAGVDFNTIMLLAGMMLIVGITRRTGVFEYLAIRSVKLARAQPAGILLGLSAATAVVSALLDNVTTVLLVVPVTIAIARQLQVPAYPLLVGEVMASNIGGTATLVGDPPNIMIGSAADLSFNAFVLNLTPVVVIVLGANALALHLLWGRKLTATPENRQRVLAMNEREAITDPVLLTHCLWVLAAVLLISYWRVWCGSSPGPSPWPARWCWCSWTTGRGPPKTKPTGCTPASGTWNGSPCSSSSACSSSWPGWSGPAESIGWRAGCWA